MPDVEHVTTTTDGLQALFDALRGRGYRLVGPTLAGGAIVYDDIDGIADLPRGLTDAQDAGRYRLLRRSDDALFGYAVGPQSWKKFLHPPTRRLWSATSTAHGVTVTPEPLATDRFAFIGVRACDLAAIAVQDRVFTGGPHVDRSYQERRRNTFIVAVDCGVAGGTCFCVSMQTGPKADRGYDLALTELLAPEHRFVIRAGSDAGRSLIAELAPRPATAEETTAADAVPAATAAGMGRRMRTDDVHDLLMRNPRHPRWDEVAGRCLTCTNCTMVCPTCFCTTVEDASDLTGIRSERTQRWDSCFTMDFSWVHGGSVRHSAPARYRQWLTHKLATWWDQFGTSGCVGCGRCITWCPVGIDITEEVAAIRDSDGATAPASPPPPAPPARVPQ